MNVCSGYLGILHETYYLILLTFNMLLQLHMLPQFTNNRLFSKIKIDIFKVTYVTANHRSPANWINSLASAGTMVSFDDQISDHSISELRSSNADLVSFFSNFPYISFRCVHAA